jgi:hypothetical protein
MCFAGIALRFLKFLSDLHVLIFFFSRSFCFLLCEFFRVLRDILIALLGRHGALYVCSNWIGSNRTAGTISPDLNHFFISRLEL